MTIRRVTHMCGGEDKTTGPKDSTGPSVDLAADRDSVSANGAVVLTVAATDAGGVAKVEFHEGGVQIAEQNQAPYTLTIDYTAAGNGVHGRTATAEDASGNRTTSAPVLVTVAIPNLRRFDDFDDGETDPTQWISSNPFNSDPGPGAEEKNGRMELFIPASASGSVFGRTLATACLTSGDFDVPSGATTESFSTRT